MMWCNRTVSRNRCDVIEFQSNCVCLQSWQDSTSREDCPAVTHLNYSYKLEMLAPYDGNDVLDDNEFLTVLRSCC